MIEIIPAYREIDDVRVLFKEYTEMLGLDLKFQNYESEYNNLPGKYDLPGGRLFLALFNKEIAGCVALKKIQEGVCEMKRLYVRPSFQGYGLGKILVQKVICEAKDAGYKKMYLDTVTSLEKAIKMYKKLGFKEIAPYYDNPLEDVLYLGLDL